MDKQKFPFYIKSVECPVCHSFTDNYVLKSKVVVPNKIDTDNYVISWSWIDKSCNKVVPPFYFLWGCKQCGYSDSPDNFQAFLQAPTREFLNLKAALLKKTASSKAFFQKILPTLEFPVDGISFEVAMTLHLLTLYCYDALMAGDVNNECLGRYYLRHSWLFRDYRRLKLCERAYAGFPSYNAFLRSLQPFWNEIPLREQDSLKRAADCFSSLINEDFNFEEAVKNIKEVFFSAELYLKLNDYEKALDIVNRVIRHGMDARQSILQYIATMKKNGDLKGKDEIYLNSKINKISKQIMNIRDKYDDVSAAWVKFYSSDIEKVFDNAAGLFPDKIIEKLSETDIPAKVIEILKQNDSRLQNNETKKAFWQFWKH